MVAIEGVTRLSDRREQTSSETFPSDALESIRSAVEHVPESVFEGTTKHTEIGEFDAQIAGRLPGYEYEASRAGGYNPICKLWSHLGFDYSVDLYDRDKRIAIEVEKSERKNISDDLLKFQKGYRTQQDGRPKIEFGCLVVPVNTSGESITRSNRGRSHDLMGASSRTRRTAQNSRVSEAAVTSDETP